MVYGLPINSMVIFHGELLNNQRVFESAMMKETFSCNNDWGSSAPISSPSRTKAKCLVRMLFLEVFGWYFPHVWPGCIRIFVWTFSLWKLVNILSAKNRWSTSLVCFHACVSSRVSWVFPSMNLIYCCSLRVINSSRSPVFYWHHSKKGPAR